MATKITSRKFLNTRLDGSKEWHINGKAYAFKDLSGMWNVTVKRYKYYKHGDVEMTRTGFVSSKPAVINFIKRHSK